MLRYLKEYKLDDMRQLARNSKTPPFETSGRLDHKTLVISGATSGVGYAGAKALARAGARVILVARNETKARRVISRLKEIGSESPIYYLADFTSLRDVRRVTKQILTDIPVIDILINSAGIHSTRRILTSEGHESVFCVNHLAPFIFTIELLPAVNRAHQGRIIQVSSQGHRFGGLDIDDVTWKKRPYIGVRGYGAAKSAQLLTTWEIADRILGTGTTINAMHPGAVKSSIGQNNGPLYRWFSRNIIQPRLDDPIISAKSLYYLAADSELASVSGKYFNLTHIEKPAPHALDKKLQKLIWQKTVDLVGVDL